MSNHTFGPWKATAHGAIEYANGFVGEAYDYNPGFDAMEGDKLPHIANARLMAAAPEMLRLIQRLTSPHMAEMDYRMEAFIDAAELINQLNSDD